MTTLAQDFVRDQRGAAMLEFTLVVVLMFVMTFGIVDFGRAFWLWNSAEKATQIGVRAAIIADPLLADLATYDCNNASVTLGTPCRLGGDTFGTVECRGDTMACTVTGGGGGLAGGPVVAAPLNMILDRMRVAFPSLQAANVIVEYRDIGLGFAGRQDGPVPAVTVRLTGLTYNFLALGDLLGMGAITMPDFKATLIGEDLSSAGR